MSFSMPSPVAVKSISAPVQRLHNKLQREGKAMDWREHVTGPLHEPQWHVVLVVDGHDRTIGHGSSKRLARDKAARAELDMAAREALASSLSLPSRSQTPATVIGAPSSWGGASRSRPSSPSACSAIF